MATREGNPDAVSEDMLRAMNVTRESLRDRQKQKRTMDAVAPSVGDVAPDFSVTLIGSDGRLSCRKVTLQDFRNQTLALLFGSYTCPIFRGQISQYQEIYEEFKDRVAFLWIYILEAHPENGWRVPHNFEIGINVPLPKTIVERADVAARCITETRSRIPTALDDMNDTAMTAYAGSPERLYVVDRSGVVRHKSSIGPFDAEDIETWRSALMKSAII